ncbi:MAG TPA: pirin family protein [Thermoanaerobaculia bacterium]|nr:pirin family protein [Thermoanaerobaculia bacterium]
MERSVRRIAETTVHPGMNPQHRVRMVLEPGNWAEHDPFLMLAEDWFVPGTFGDHPHRGFETVTFVLEGEIEHRDNHGGRGVLRPGDAQWMTAGRGVVHSEEAGRDGAHSLQLWLNLPRALKMSEPRYQDLRGAEMPVRTVDGAQLRVFSGMSADVKGPALNHVPVTMVEMRLDAGATVRQELPPRYNAFLYVIEGSGKFGKERTPAHAAQVVWFNAEEGDVVIEAETPMRAILYAGAPLKEPVASRGPFVMNTMGEVMQAFTDYQSGKF